MSIKCHNCLKQTSINNLEINNRTFGSLFDSLDISINLCNECIDLLGVNTTWFDNKASYSFCDNNGIKSYEFEFKIIKLINSLPIESQEQILNKPNPSLPFKMNRVDWINTYQNGYFNI